MSAAFQELQEQFPIRIIFPACSPSGRAHEQLEHNTHQSLSKFLTLYIGWEDIIYNIEKHAILVGSTHRVRKSLQSTVKVPSVINTDQCRRQFVLSKETPKHHYRIGPEWHGSQISSCFITASTLHNHHLGGSSPIKRLKWIRECVRQRELGSLRPQSRIIKYVNEGRRGRHLSVNGILQDSTSFPDDSSGWNWSTRHGRRSCGPTAYYSIQIPGNRSMFTTENSLLISSLVNEARKLVNYCWRTKDLKIKCVRVHAKFSSNFFQLSNRASPIYHFNNHV